MGKEGQVSKQQVAEPNVHRNQKQELLVFGQHPKLNAMLLASIRFHNAMKLPPTKSCQIKCLQCNTYCQSSRKINRTFNLALLTLQSNQKQVNMVNFTSYKLDSEIWSQVLFFFFLISRNLSHEVASCRLYHLTIHSYSNQILYLILPFYFISNYRLPFYCFLIAGGTMKVQFQALS